MSVLFLILAAAGCENTPPAALKQSAPPTNDIFARAPAELVADTALAITDIDSLQSGKEAVIYLLPFRATQKEGKAPLSPPIKWALAHRNGDKALKWDLVPGDYERLVFFLKKVHNEYRPRQTKPLTAVIVNGDEASLEEIAEMADLLASIRKDAPIKTFQVLLASGEESKLTVPDSVRQLSLQKSRRR